jgi:tetratricopeptide (TPR) repeat protein
MAFEPLSSLDSELFIEGDDEFPGDDESSMLSHIPVEEIALTEEALEIEIEIEVEGEAFAEIESVEPAAPRAEEPAPPVIETRPYTAEAARREPSERRPHGSRPSEPPASSPAPVGGFESRGETDTDEPSRAEVAASRAEAMRRMRQGGGEARLLRDVKLHFKLQDWEGVVPLLEQLVQISPGSGLYRGMLARAMSRHPVMRKNAEEHFIEALRLAPHDAELHYWLGLYYKSFGLKSRAYTEFRSTLRIEPQHEGARKQLAGDRKDDAVGTVIKKIFG